MAIIYRDEKGSQLTHTEVDNNFRELDEIPNGKIFPKTSNIGIKVDKDDPTFPWHDLIGNLHTYNTPNTAREEVFIGSIRALAFQENEEAFCNFHLPHDYLPGTDLFIHVHWTHPGTNVTGGTVTWVFETTYAKGHNQESFTSPVLVPIVQTVDSTQYKHYVSETSLSIAGGSGNQLNTNTLEVDGVVSCRLYLDSNDMTLSGGVAPDCFALFVDIHYQSSGLGTKNKAPNFYS